MSQIACLLDSVLSSPKDEKIIKMTKKEALKLTQKFPLYKEL